MHDAALVLAILDGEVERFSELVSRYDERVRRVIGWSVADQDAREELTQQTFYRAFRALDQLGVPHKLEPWLLRIARNCARDHLRRQRQGPVSAPSPDGFAAREGETEDWIWDEVAQLGAAQREVLELRYRVGLDYAQIAERLSVPVSTVRGRIYTARKALRARLQPQEQREDEL